MRLRCVLLARATIGNMGMHDDQRWLRALSLGCAEGGVESWHVVTVGDLLHMPAVGVEAFVHRFGEGKIGVAIDGDIVIIIEIDQLAKL